MKILYVTTISGTMGFFPEHIRMLQAAGHTVEMACNLTDPLPEKAAVLNCRTYHIDFSRNPVSPDNRKAYRQLKALLQQEQYDIVHTHTPNASMLVRLAARKLRRQGLKVFYTCHGFHFYKGAPLKNWIFFYPVEWICAHFTDKLLTINGEDYALAKKHMHACQVIHVHGVGFDSGKFKNLQTDRTAVRKNLGLTEGQLALLSVGEVNRNKNHQVILRAIKKAGRPELQYFIAGCGDQEQPLKDLAQELGISQQVHLLGYRTDVAQLYHAADVCCFPTIREGLGLAGLEGMASGLPLLAADNRGTRDYCIDHVNSIVCQPMDADGFAEALIYFLDHPEERRIMAEKAQESVAPFDTEAALREMKDVYFS